jgi:hypothetical protein
VFEIKRFEQFLRKEISVENLLFYQDVLAFKKGKISADEIFQTYISRNSLLQINISDKIRRDLSIAFNENLNLDQSSDIIFRSYNSNARSISSQLKRPSASLLMNKNKNSVNFAIFDSAVEQIYRLLLNDSFQRFSSSSCTKSFILFMK